MLHWVAENIVSLHYNFHSCPALLIQKIILSLKAVLHWVAKNIEEKREIRILNLHSVAEKCLWVEKKK